MALASKTQTDLCANKTETSFPPEVKETKDSSLRVSLVSLIHVTPRRTLHHSFCLKQLNPILSLAKSSEMCGADELCLMNSAPSGRQLRFLVSAISAVCAIPLTVGARVQKLRDVEKLLAAGADKVAIDCAVLTDVSFVTECVNKFGSHRIVASAQYKMCNGDWCLRPRRIVKPIALMDCINSMQECGVGQILLTALDRRHSSIGFDLPLLKFVSTFVSVPVTTSIAFGLPFHAATALINGGASAVAITARPEGNCFSIPQVKFLLSLCGIVTRTNQLNLLEWPE